MALNDVYGAPVNSVKVRLREYQGKHVVAIGKVKSYTAGKFFYKQVGDELCLRVRKDISSPDNCKKITGKGQVIIISSTMG